MAESTVQEGLVRAAVETLRPIVKRLIASGVPFGRLEARLRELFAEVAEREFPVVDRPQTDSRIALLTGLNRKEVRRLRSADAEPRTPAAFGRNQAASLISRWVTDRRMTDRAGKPRPIPYRAARGPSFVKLARVVAVDLPPRAILDELVRTGAVRLRPGNLVALESDAYVPTVGRPEKLAMLAEDPAELIETMLSNILGERRDLLLQRKVFYDNLGADGIARVRAQMRHEGERFLNRVNRLLARHDRDRNPRAVGGDRRYGGIGVYYFEAPVEPAQRASRARPGARRPRKERRE